MPSILLWNPRLCWTKVFAAWGLNFSLYLTDCNTFKWCETSSVRTLNQNDPGCIRGKVLRYCSVWPCCRNLRDKMTRSHTLQVLWPASSQCMWKKLLGSAHVMSNNSSFTCFEAISDITTSTNIVFHNDFMGPQRFTFVHRTVMFPHFPV